MSMCRISYNRIELKLSYCKNTIKVVLAATMSAIGWMLLLVNAKISRCFAWRTVRGASRAEPSRAEAFSAKTKSARSWAVVFGWLARFGS